MTEATNVVLELPYSTGECDSGPEIIHRPGRVSLRYDAETDRETVWTTLEFEGVVALLVTPDLAVEADVVAAYSRVCELRASRWVAELRDLDTEGQLSEELRHFFVYFDHFVAVEVVATEVRLAGAGR